jgi:hypothetical protein
MYFQGETGRTPLALDVTRIWELMGDRDLYAVGLQTTDLDRGKGLDKELVSHVRQLASSLGPLSVQFYTELCKWGIDMTELLGEDTNKAELYGELRAIYSNAKRIGVWPENVDQSSVGEILKQFNACPLAEIRSLYMDAEKAQTEAARMAVLGRVDPKELQDTAVVMSTIARFISNMNGLVEARRNALTGLDKKPVIDDLLEELDAIASNMAMLNVVDAEVVRQGVGS